MKQKTFVMDDPELDRIFTETYRETMAGADLLEKDRRLADHVDAYVELFQRELSGRDLTDSERSALTEVFRSRLLQADRIRANRSAAKRTRTRKTAMIAGGLAAFVLLIVVATYRPFKPIDEVTNSLDGYIERVEAGSGGFADEFYKLLDRYDRRLDDSVEREYRARMYEVLDQRFQELLSRLNDGDVTLIDDARKWAKLFPERAERSARKDLVENAAFKGVEGAARKLFDKLRDWGEEAVDWVETRIEENRK